MRMRWHCAPLAEIRRTGVDQVICEAGRKLLRRFAEGGSDFLDRPAATISFERADQLLDSALNRRFLADECVPQIEEEPASILHSWLISGFAHAEGALIGRNRPVWCQIRTRALRIVTATRVL